MISKLRNWMDQKAKTLGSRRWMLVLLGASLVAVPTVFTVFPELTASVSTRWRLVIVGGWLLLVMATVGLTAARDRRIEAMAAELTLDRVVLRNQLKIGALAMALRTSLDTPEIHGIPACYEFTLYVHDPDVGLLKPVYPRWDNDGPDVRVFEPGKGATGYAWQTESLVIVKGEAVANTRYGLTDDQQTFWGEYRRALSYPLYEDLTTKIGALTALSKEEDDYFDSPAGQALFHQLADTMAVYVLALLPVRSVTSPG